MSLVSSVLRLQRSSLYAWRTVVRPYAGDEGSKKPSALQSVPEKPVAEEQASEKPSAEQSVPEKPVAEEQNMVIPEAMRENVVSVPTVPADLIERGILPKIPYWNASDDKIKVKPFRKIPGPRSFFFGNIWRYWPIVGEYSFERLHETYLSMFKKYGYVVKEKVHLTRTIVHVYHPEDICCVYRCAGKYPMRLSHRAMAIYRRERLHLYNSTGLGPSNGEEWRAFRSRFIKVGSHSIISQQNPMVKEVTGELVEIIQRGLNRKGEIDVLQPLFRYALESVGVAILSSRLGCLYPDRNPEADRLIKAAHATHDAIYNYENRMSPLVKWREYKRLAKAQDFFSEVVRKYVVKSLSENEASVVDTLINEEGREITIQDVYTLVLDLFQGSIHSVSYTISFALLHLAKNKDKQDKLREDVIKNGIRSRYLKNVIKETLRLNPPTIGTGRILVQNMVLGGYNVPAGTMVILHNQVASLSPEFFTDPLLFEPERFDGNDLGVGKTVAQYAYKPFGFGSRTCIGMSVANMEMVHAISQIILNFEVSYHHKPVGIVNKLHNEPDRPVLLKFERIAP